MGRIGQICQSLGSLNWICLRKIEYFVWNEMATTCLQLVRLMWIWMLQNRDLIVLITFFLYWRQYFYVNLIRASYSASCWWIVCIRVQNNVYYYNTRYTSLIPILMKELFHLPFLRWQNTRLNDNRI